MLKIKNKFNIMCVGKQNNANNSGNNYKVEIVKLLSIQKCISIK